MNLDKKNIFGIICVIIIISLGFKLFFIDFSTPFNSDNLGYLLRSFSHLNGNFDQHHDKGIGWSLFLSPFLTLIDSENILDYSNLVRVISLTISSSSIILFYFIARKFFDVKYSLIAISLYAFEPHLNYYSGIGLAEPFYLFILMASFFFAIQKQNHYIIPSLILAATSWWVRINGIGIIVLIGFIILISQKRTSKNIGIFILGIVISIIVISPILIQRENQYDDPFYTSYSGKLFVENYDMLISKNVSENNSASKYIEIYGIESFIEKFVIMGFFNTLTLLMKLCFPYLIFLFPIGVLFSIRAFDQKQELILANWIFILGNIILLLVILSNVPERRYLIFLIPFIIIISTIPIQRLIEYGLSTFSLSLKQKNFFLLGIICLVIIMSLSFSISQYEKSNISYENEKLELAKYVVNNLDGLVLDNNGDSFEYTSYVLSTTPHGDFKSVNNYNKKVSKVNPDFQTMDIYASSIDELITIGKDYELKYIIVDKNSGFFHSYIKNIYENEDQYPYLKKIFDSEIEGMRYVKSKIFEINYDKFIFD